MEYIAFDAHKHYTLASVASLDGELVREARIEHDRGALRQFLERCEHGSPVVLETIGNWVLDRRRDRGRRLPPQTRARPQGEAHDGDDQ